MDAGRRCRISASLATNAALSSAGSQLYIGASCSSDASCTSEPSYSSSLSDRSNSIWRTSMVESSKFSRFNTIGPNCPESGISLTLSLISTSSILEQDVCGGSVGCAGKREGGRRLGVVACIWRECACRSLRSAIQHIMSTVIPCSEQRDFAFC